MTRKWTRRASEQLDDFSSLVNTVANVAAVVAHKVIRRRRQQISYHGGSPLGRRFRKRKRRSVRDIYEELGDVYFRRAYRMKYDTFNRLATELSPYIIAASGKKQRSSNYLHNGAILPEVRLACALRWFSGGSIYDIMTTFGVSHTDAIDSCWFVVDAINRHPNFTIKYPEDHNAQYSIAEGFRRVSSADFGCCAGAIDGLLIWIHKPSSNDCIESGCSNGKFYCGRKKKFGLNCQAVCDARGRILDLSIVYPGSTSDCLAFEGMSLFQKLEDGILAPGLCLFGDNAYLNTPYLATPYAAVKGGTKDAYNYYHSQLRIRIECTFGILTHRWGILRSAIPMNVSVGKTIALVVALAKLHNFCIVEANDTVVLPATARDEWQNEVNGAVPLVRQTEHPDSDGIAPRQLLNGGFHFDDVGNNGRYNRQRRYNYVSATMGTPLPRDMLHSFVASSGLTRPSHQHQVSRQPLERNVQ